MSSSRREVGDDRRMRARELAQLVDVVRIGQEAHVEDEVGVERHAVLVAERHDRDVEDARFGGRIGRMREPLLERGQRERRGVDDDVGRVADRFELAAFGDDAVDDAAAIRERMLAARLRVAPDEHLVARVEEDDPVGDAFLAQRAQLPDEIAEHLFTADVEDERDAAQVAAAGEQLGELRDEARREVVDAEVAEVLEAFRGLALARARHAGDDDHMRGRQRARGLARRLCGLLERLRLHVFEYWPSQGFSPAVGAEGTGGEPRLPARNTDA